MNRDELPTVGFINDCFQAVLARLTEAGPTGPAVASAPPRLLSIEDVMRECGVNRSTVQRWMKKGKPGRHGGIITLQHYLFSTAQPRIPWPALAAFGQGLGFDLSTLNLGAVSPPDAPAAGAARPKR